MSALDVSIQAQIVNLLDDLQDELGLSYIFVAHDLSVVRHVSDRIAVMYLGKIVELSSADAVYVGPKHPYTASLLDAIPIPDPTRAEARPVEPHPGRAAQPDQPAAGLPLPHPVPVRDRHLPRRSSRRWRSSPDGHLAACHHPLNVTEAERNSAVRSDTSPLELGAELTLSPAGRAGAERAGAGVLIPAPRDRMAVGQHAGLPNAGSASGRRWKMGSRRAGKN